ncbi:MAG: nucleoside kinase [Oscillospiraceae bacterium]|nr:nucleoside kinase [Oscillospiraceae bacterium]
MRLLTTATMNRRAADTDAFIANSEEQYLWQLKMTAQFLIEQEAERPLILLSGPSGSGKTTTAFRLREQLCELGVKTHSMSMDNYFLSVDDPRNEREADGTIDYESPKRLDMDLLNEHMEKLWECTEFTLPVFDFANQRQLEGEKFKRGEHEMIILEGIHSLNPKVTGKFTDVSAGVYVSVRTRIKAADGSELHPEKIRLMRRLVRDKLFRNRKAEQTLKFFEAVQVGEEKYIAPYKCYAEHDIDTFLAYEAAAYKEFIVKELEELINSNDFTGLSEYQDMVKVLEELNGVSMDGVPKNSLVREFIGGSVFKY